MTTALGIDTKITLLAAGLIFLLALVPGVWKYRQIMTSDEHRAHPYVDIAHRASLLYSFATLLIAVFVELSAWPTWVNLTAAMVVVFFFVGAIIGYISHDPSKDLGHRLAKAYVKAGLKVALVFETTVDEAEHGAATGAADRVLAEQRARLMGYPEDSPIFYGVDDRLPRPA